MASKQHLEETKLGQSGWHDYKKEFNDEKFKMVVIEDINRGHFVVESL